MKKLLCVLMLGLVFGQTKLETRVYEIENNFVENVHYEYYWDNIIGMDLEEGIVTLVNITYDVNPSISFHKLQFEDGSLLTMTWLTNSDGSISTTDADQMFLRNRDYFYVEYSSLDDNAPTSPCQQLYISKEQLVISIPDSFPNDKNVLPVLELLP